MNVMRRENRYPKITIYITPI